MTITEHGLSCDVCNDYILLEPSGNPFRIFGVEGLHAHEKCKRTILSLDIKEPLFWRNLPDGRVRQLAEDIHERAAVRNDYAPAAATRTTGCHHSRPEEN